MSTKDEKDNKIDELDLKNYVENKIIRIIFKAQNFNREEMKRVDDYCKKHYGDDRKKMILSLISFAENNVQINLLNEKLNRFIIDVSDEFDTIDDKFKKPVEKKKKEWKLKG